MRRPPDDQTPDLFSPDEFRWGRNGATIDDHLDAGRLARQATVVFRAMKDARWRTLSEISRITGEPEASISARLRDFRKERFGGFIVNRRRRGAAERGLFEYQLDVAAEIPE